jgi:hypothetical protein
VTVTSYMTTVFVTITCGVTLAIQFAVIAGQNGAISLWGAATRGSFVAVAMTPHRLMAFANSI